MTVSRTVLAQSFVNSTNQATFNVTISGGTGRKLIFTGGAEALSGSLPNISSITFNTTNNFTLAVEAIGGSTPSNNAAIWYYDVPDATAAGTYQIVATWNNAADVAYAVTEVTGLVAGGAQATGTQVSASVTSVSASATAATSRTYGVSCVSGGNNQAVATATAGTEYAEQQPTSSGAVLGASDENTFGGTGSKTMGWTTTPSINRFNTAIALWNIIKDDKDGAAMALAANF